MKFVVIALIRFYQKCISPLFPPKCKYYPTCSCYALTAVKKFGAIRGSALAAWRIMRCNPWSLGGIDYVPEKFTFKVKKIDYSKLHSEADITVEKNGTEDSSDDVLI